MAIWKDKSSLERLNDSLEASKAKALKAGYVAETRVADKCSYVTYGSAVTSPVVEDYMTPTGSWVTASSPPSVYIPTYSGVSIPTTITPSVVPEHIFHAMVDHAYQEHEKGHDIMLSFAHILLAHLEVTYDGNFNIRIKE